MTEERLKEIEEGAGACDVCQACRMEATELIAEVRRLREENERLRDDLGTARAALDSAMSLIVSAWQ